MALQQHVASVTFISQVFPHKAIEIVFNQLVAQVDNSPKKSPKYKKVGKSTKAMLLEMVEHGSTIVSVPIYRI
jgi:hypothetical protein